MNSSIFRGLLQADFALIRATSTNVRWNSFIEPFENRSNQEDKFLRNIKNEKRKLNITHCSAS